MNGIKPDILGISVYIWNVNTVREVLEKLRRKPDCPLIILGGPEAGFLPENHPINRLADFIVRGEGEDAFRVLCDRFLRVKTQNGTENRLKNVEKAENDRHAAEILRFFREKGEKDLDLHFELIPDRLGPCLRGEIELFPLGMLHFEVGIQTYNPGVAARINRRCDFDAADENLRFFHSLFASFEFSLEERSI